MLILSHRVQIGYCAHFMEDTLMEPLIRMSLCRFVRNIFSTAVEQVGVNRLDPGTLELFFAAGCIGTMTSYLFAYDTNQKLYVVIAEIFSCGVYCLGCWEFTQGGAAIGGVAVLLDYKNGCLWPGQLTTVDLKPIYNVKWTVWVNRRAEGSDILCAEH